LVISSQRPRVQVHVADDVVDKVLAGGRESVHSPRRGMSPSRKLVVPRGAGPGRAEHDQGFSGFAYDADGPEVLGFGPGFTLLMGLPPTLQPSATAWTGVRS
jgi:hypothetical protein